MLSDFVALVAVGASLFPCIIYAGDYGQRMTQLALSIVRQLLAHFSAFRMLFSGALDRISQYDGDGFTPF